jgi:hypothetical protein
MDADGPSDDDDVGDIIKLLKYVPNQQGNGKRQDQAYGAACRHIFDHMPSFIFRHDRRIKK